MMDRHFGVPADPAISPDYVRIRSFDVEPYPDGRRLKCTLEITGSNASPNVEIFNKDHEGHVSASSSIIGLVNSIAIFTVHIREPAQARSYTAKILLTDPDEGLVDQKVIGFSIPHASNNAGE
jgi:hypothetical protein